MLNFLYGLFLLILTIAPVFILYQLYSIGKVFSESVIDDLEQAIAAIKKYFVRALAQVKKAKNKLTSAIADVKKLKNHIEALEDTLENVDEFTNKITDVTSEAFDLIDDFSIPIPATFKPNFVSFTERELNLGIGKVTVVTPPITLRRPFTFQQMNLSKAAKSLNIPGLEEAKEGFEQLEEMSANVIQTLTSVPDPLKDAHKAFQRVIDSIEDFMDLKDEIEEIEERLDKLENKLRSFKNTYFPKLRLVAMATGVFLVALLLEWGLGNIVKAFELMGLG